MPQYAISTAAGLRPLGKFDSIEEVKKLRMFKDNPDLINRVEVVITKAKPVFKSNRWRVITTDRYFDYISWYTKAEAEALTFAATLPNLNWVLIHVPKYAYHETDGPII